MFPDLYFVDYVMILLGVLLCCKKVAEMERYHELRVIVLTLIVGAFLLFFFVAFSSTLHDPFQYDCPGPEYFCHTEM